MAAPPAGCMRHKSSLATTPACHGIMFRRSLLLTHLLAEASLPRRFALQNNLCTSRQRTMHNAPMHQCTNAPMHQCTNAPMHQCNAQCTVPRATRNASVHNAQCIMHKATASNAVRSAPTPQCNAPMQCTNAPMHHAPVPAPMILFRLAVLWRSLCSS